MKKDNCQKPIDLLVGYLEQEDFNAAKVAELTAQYPDCQKSIETTYALWSELDTLEIPEPSATMHTNFYKKLNEYSVQKQSKATEKYGFFKNISTWNFALKPALNWAFALGLLIFGFFAGQFYTNQQAKLVAMAQEINDLKKQNGQKYQVNLQQSVAGRMKDIHFVRQMENPNDPILKALNKALCEDPNINVRLAAIETLVTFSDDPMVMEILIKAIPKQSSSLVQLELAAVMIQLEEKRSAEAWKELLESGEVELEVKMQLEESLQTLL